MKKYFDFFNDKRGYSISRLELFIAADCPSCVYAENIARRAATHFPELEVTITDIDQPNVEVPDAVFAVPTFCLDDRVISLGTPEWHALTKKIKTYLAKLAKSNSLTTPPSLNEALAVY